MESNSNKKREGPKSSVIRVDRKIHAWINAHKLYLETTNQYLKRKLKIPDSVFKEKEREQEHEPTTIGDTTNIGDSSRYSNPEHWRSNDGPESVPNGQGSESKFIDRDTKEPITLSMATQEPERNDNLDDIGNDGTHSTNGTGELRQFIFGETRDFELRK